MEGDVAGGLPDRVARFISEHVDSVEQLETLLLLRAEPRAWTADELGSRLRTLPASVELRLRGLLEHGLAVHEDGAWRLAGDADGELVDDVAGCWKARRVAVIAQIFAEPEDDPVRDFADAFRLRKDDA